MNSSKGANFQIVFFSSIQQFKEISAAAEILGDADKRKVYDQHGLEGLEGGGGGGESAEDLFSMFFGGGGGRGGGRRGPQKGEDIVHTIKVSLENMYNGKTVRLAISRNKPCEECEGIHTLHTIAIHTIYTIYTRYTIHTIHIIYTIHTNTLYYTIFRTGWQARCREGMQ